MPTKREEILAIAKKRGVIRARDLVGIDGAFLRRLRDEGVLTKSARGLYSLADYDITEAHSLVEAVQAQAKGVVCLLSAVSFHGLGTQLPFQVWLAVPNGSRISKIEPVPLRIVVIKKDAFEAGIEKHVIEGVTVPIYSVAKTVADCFKFRNKIGLDVAIEVLRAAIRDRRCSRDEIRKHARIDRVERVMQPYLEALSA